MAKVSVYLNFPGTCESAFLFYRSIFGGEFSFPFSRFSDMPHGELSDEVKSQVMHVSLPILGGFELMGSDAPEELGLAARSGTTTYLNLETDTRVEAERLFAGLRENATVQQELQEMFWGDYYGALTDQFGIQWMFNCAAKE